MSSLLLYDCSCNPNTERVVGCVTCSPGAFQSASKIAEVTQKRIQNQVRVPSSVYAMNLGSVNIAGPFSGDSSNKPLTSYNNVNWNQSSDRNRPANSLISMNFRRNVPSHGNSTKYTLTRHRPGASAPGGVGVDIKHNSYDRYLGRLKSKTIRGQRTNIAIAVKGNKTRKYGILSSICDCPPFCCQNITIGVTPPPIPVVGDKVTSTASTATGSVTSIIATGTPSGFPEVIIKVDDCDNLFTAAVDNTNLIIGGDPYTLSEILDNVPCP
jgi:hypothetical protein